MRFTKMHGCGNDYIYIDGFQENIPDPVALAIKLSDRHKGIGGDGIILMLPSEIADCRMRIFNIDGSEGMMCGNGVRCVAKLAYDKGYAHKEHITVETLSGIKYCDMKIENDQVVGVKVDMGAPILEAKRIPVLAKESPVIKHSIVVLGEEYKITCVSMGNPHAVIFTKGIKDLDLAKIGPYFEFHTLFPERVNTEFIEIIDDHSCNMRVWERGSGETHACGTGSCASVVAGVLNGYFKEGTDVTVHLLGGDLIINATKEKVYMTGEAITVFEGEVAI